MNINNIIKKFSILIALLVLAIAIPNRLVQSKAKGKLFDSVDEIPVNKVGLILGAGKIAPSGNINLFYKYRLEAAVKLYRSGKIDFLLVSGDNGRKDYDEPSDFKSDLIKQGIPENRIFLDYAGFRTLDSVIRAKEIFGQQNLTIISQEFHNERAIFLAEHHNINAIGFNAKAVSKNFSRKTQLREYLARTKAVIDILFNVQPKYLGEKIKIK